MKIPLKIGERNFSSKKEALLHYRNILNSYSFGQSLNDVDFEDLMALLNYDYQVNLSQFTDKETLEIIGEPIGDVAEATADTVASEEVLVENILVAKVQFSTKCFEVFYSNGTSYYISYSMLVNRQGYTPEKLFITACRNCIQGDLIRVKQAYFKVNSIKGKVKCQETNQLSSWDELAVDHRQPNTLSVIIDRFREVKEVEVGALEYQTKSDNLIIFKDQELTQAFIAYHRDKATLRIVRKECNSARSAMARVKKSAKDLTISQTQLPLF